MLRHLLEAHLPVMVFFLIAAGIYLLAAVLSWLDGRKP